MAQRVHPVTGAPPIIAAWEVIHALINVLFIAIIVGLGAGAYCSWRNHK